MTSFGIRHGLHGIRSTRTVCDCENVNQKNLKFCSVWQLQKKSINSILWFSIKVTIHSIFKFFDHVKFRNHFIFVTYLIIWLRKSAKNFEKTSTSEVSKSSFGLWSTKSIKTQQLRLHKKTSLSACILSWSKSWIYLLTYILSDFVWKQRALIWILIANKSMVVNASNLLT